VEPDSLPGVDSLNPTTAEDILAGILRRDGAQTSATSTRRILDAPATQLRDAVLRYQDALGRAADPRARPSTARRPQPSRRAAPHRLTTQPAYPTLRSRLALRALDGQNPTRVLRRSAELHELVTADDPAAVPTGASATARPSLARSRHTRTAARHRDWGGYITDRARRVRDLVEEVHASAADPAARQRLPWAEAIADATDVALPGDLAVWRAALGIPHDDLRPTSACR
jgi:hypothetical protein